MGEHDARRTREAQRTWFEELTMEQVAAAVLRVPQTLEVGLHVPEN